MRVKVTMHLDVPVGYNAAAYGSAISQVKAALAHQGLRTGTWHMEFIDPPASPRAVNSLGPTGKSS